MTIRIPGDELNEEIARLNPSGASTWLVAVTLPGGEILRFCRSSSAVEFLGYSWTPFPFNEPSIRQDQNGELVTSRISYADPTGFMADLIRVNNQLDDAAVTLYHVFTSLTATPTDGSGRLNYLRFDFIVARVMTSRKGGEIELGKVPVESQPVPAKLANRWTCPWTYKDADCAYAGGLATCDRSWDGANGCITHDNAANFGGFPGKPRQ